MTWLKALCTKKVYMHIYTVQDISNHINTTSSTSTHILNSQTVQKRCLTNQERSVLWKVFFFFFQIYINRGERWRVADGCRKSVPDFSCLKVERSVSSRCKASFGDFQQFFYCWTEESEKVGRCEAVLKGTGEENSQSAWKRVWQFCSGYGPQQVACSLFFFLFSES